MSPSPTSQDAAPEDWRAQAARQMEMAEALPPVEEPSGADLGLVFAKLGFLVVLSAALVYFLGFGTLFAVGLVGWYLFWPR